MNVEIFVLLFVGILILFLAFQIYSKEKIELIHSYHYKRVKDEDKRAYCKQMGKGLFLIGLGIVLTAIFQYLLFLVFAWIIFTNFLVIGLLLIIFAQIKYNHGIF